MSRMRTIIDKPQRGDYDSEYGRFVLDEAYTFRDILSYMSDFHAWGKIKVYNYRSIEPVLTYDYNMMNGVKMLYPPELEDEIEKIVNLRIVKASYDRCWMNININVYLNME